MNSLQYQEFCLRTVSKEQHFWAVDFDGDISKSRADLMTNCALGIAGEASEISELPSSDEIGDGFWYSYVLLRALNVDSYEPNPSSKEDCLKEAFYLSGKICELVKKLVFHGRNFDVVREPMIRATKQYIDSIAGLDTQSVSATFEQNIGKLKKRYPEGFVELG